MLVVVFVVASVPDESLCTTGGRSPFFLTQYACDAAGVASVHRQQ